MNELQLQIEALKERFVSGYHKSIDVDEGWYQIVLDCHKQLIEIDIDYKINQIKQKFAGLRYYMTPSVVATPEQRDRMHAIVGKYERFSFEICEATGKPGVLMKSPTGYLKTLNPRWAAQHSIYSKYVEVNNQVI
jgi:hypothetical protein